MGRFYVVFALMALYASASATPEYTIIDLHLPFDVFGSSASSLNDGGEVVGGVQSDQYPDNNTQAYSWFRGTSTPLGFLGAGTRSYALAINNLGTITGVADVTPSGPEHLFEWKAAVMTDLGVDQPHPSAIGESINDSDVIVGEAAGGVGIGDNGFIYQDGVFTDLGDPVEPNVYVRSVSSLNESDVVVGTAQFGNGNPSHAFMYEGGSITDLGTLPGDSSSSAYGINAAGHIIGVSYPSPTTERGFLFDGVEMRDIGSLGGTNTYPISINDAGQIIGASDTALAPVHPFLFEAGTMLDLTQFLDGSAQVWHSISVNHINNHGWICGTGYSETDHIRHAILLVPSIACSAYAVTSGLYVSGSVQSLADIDGDYLVARTGSSAVASPVQFDLTGTCPVSEVTELKLNLVSHASLGGLLQRIEFYNWTNQRFESVDVRIDSVTDTKTEVGVLSPHAYIRQSDHALRARISFGTSTARSKQFTASIDRAIWKLVP